MQHDPHQRKCGATTVFSSPLNTFIPLFASFCFCFFPYFLPLFPRLSTLNEGKQRCQIGWHSAWSLLDRIQIGTRRTAAVCVRAAPYKWNIWVAEYSAPTLRLSPCRVRIGRFMCLHRFLFSIDFCSVLNAAHEIDWSCCFYLFIFFPWCLPLPCLWPVLMHSSNTLDYISTTYSDPVKQIECQPDVSDRYEFLSLSTAVKSVNENLENNLIQMCTNNKMGLP